MDRPLGEGLNFKLVTESIELDRRLSSRGTAFFDYDNDGDIDLLVTHMDAPPTLLRNDTMSNCHQRNWLLIDLEGTISNQLRWLKNPCYCWQLNPSTGGAIR